MCDLSQIFDTVNIGVITLDRDLKVQFWNRWMEFHSGVSAATIIGSPIIKHYPNLSTPRFIKNCHAVLSFGNFSFFSQKLHKYLFPFTPEATFGRSFEFMQQSCTMGPLRGKDESITSLFLIVQDVTELAASEQRLQEMNVKDPLTGVYNRRYFESRLQEECARHQRHGRELSLLMLDIDFFKVINDTCGHQCGDRVLKAIAEEVARLARKTDCLARYGGEEFCCILPETCSGSALTLAERFRCAVESLVIPDKDCGLRVTISAGVAGLRAGETSEQVLKRADEALYKAKNGGRNQVVLGS